MAIAIKQLFADVGQKKSLHFYILRKQLCFQLILLQGPITARPKQFGKYLLGKFMELNRNNHNEKA